MLQSRPSSGNLRFHCVIRHHPVGQAQQRIGEFFVSFFRTLRWKVHPDAITSVCELTALFHSLGYKLQEHSCNATYLDYHKKIRRAVVLLGRSDNAQAFPGILDPALAKAAGRTMPQGSLTGAQVYVDNGALIHLAQIFELGAGRTLASWDVPLI